MKSPLLGPGTTEFVNDSVSVWVAQTLLYSTWTQLRGEFAMYSYRPSASFIPVRRAHGEATTLARLGLGTSLFCLLTWGCAPTMAGAGGGRGGGGKGETLDQLNVDFKPVTAPWIDGTLGLEITQKNAYYYERVDTRLQTTGSVSEGETDRIADKDNESWVIPYMFSISSTDNPRKDQQACVRFTLTEHCTLAEPAEANLAVYQLEGGEDEVARLLDVKLEAQARYNEYLKRKGGVKNSSGNWTFPETGFDPSEDREAQTLAAELRTASDEHRASLGNRETEDYDLLMEGGHPAPGSADWTAVWPSHGSPRERNGRSLLESVEYEPTRPPEECLAAGSYLLLVTVRWRSDQALAESEGTDQGPLLGNPADRLRGGLLSYRRREQGVTLSGWCHGSTGCPNRRDLFDEPRFVSQRRDEEKSDPEAEDKVKDAFGGDSEAKAGAPDYTSIDYAGLDSQHVQELYSHAECTGLWDITARETGFTNALQYYSSNCLNPAGCVRGRVYLHFGGNTDSLANRALKGLQNDTTRTGGVVLIGGGTSNSAASWAREDGRVEYSEATKQLNLEGFQAVTAYLDDLMVNHNATQAPEVRTFVRGQDIALVFVYSKGTVVAVSIPATYI